MLAALQPLQEEFGYGLNVIDVDERPEFEARFGERVPVLVVDGRELCQYRLDAPAVRAYLLNLR